ncbi:MAG TPA: HEAT repeat domain-containing protein [Planctomycetota bacterium]|nr:HEAT repeat domain-containing protein [Planctomycetota bacterium]
MRAWWVLLGAALWVAGTSATALQGGRELSRRELRARLEELGNELRAPKPEPRRAAVRALAELGGEDAWRLVMGALADPDAAVGDAAQLALGGVREEKLVRELLGRGGLEAREERAVLRAAEAVGRLEVEVDGEVLARRLSSREGEVSRRLLFSIERLHRAGRLGGRPERVADLVLALVRSRRDDELAARALVTLAVLGDPRAGELARSAALARDAVERAAALVALRVLEPPDLEAVARARAADDSVAVRALALEVLRSARTKPALGVLVARLSDDPRTGLRQRVVTALREATGFPYRLDPRPWRDLVARLPADWDGRPLRAAPVEAADGRSLAKGPLKLPVDSDRVVFLFDFSGSMWTPLDDGRTPKDIVAARLRETLEGLDPATHFNLIPYAHDPQPWQERMVEASPKRVREALEFFDALTLRGKGNVYDAALLALADPEVERVVVLTDGVPTGGLHSDMDLVVPLLTEHDLLRGVAFDLVLVDAPGPKVRRWRAFAEASGGRAIEVALDVTPTEERKNR